MVENWSSFGVLIATVGIVLAYLYLNYIPRITIVIEQGDRSVSELFGRAFLLTIPYAIPVVILGGIFLFTFFGVWIIGGADIFSIFGFVLAYAVFVCYLVVLDYVLRQATHQKCIVRVALTAIFLVVCSLIGLMSSMLAFGVVSAGP